MKTDAEIQNMVSRFADQLSALIEQRVLVQTRERLLASVGGSTAGRGLIAPLGRRPPSPGRQLQGQYIGRLRKLKGEARARVQKVARQKGVAAAVALADKLIK